MRAGRSIGISYNTAEEKEAVPIQYKLNMYNSIIGLTYPMLGVGKGIAFVGPANNVPVEVVASAYGSLE